MNMFRMLRTRISRGAAKATIAGIITLLFLAPAFVVAQEDARAGRLSMTLSPPLFQVALAPGDEWSSTINLTNANPYELTVYASVQNFSPKGEGGGAFFYPSREMRSGGNRELASWMTLGEGPHVILPGESARIPFTVRVPKDAEPGGHYAAVLVGTQPGDSSGGAGMAVGSFLSSLFLVRIAGDVIEEGKIRDFFAERTFSDSQEATFHLRFENTGNVHIVPQGDIAIYNMFGKRRGQILINDANTFGNVLPESVRKFTFAWEGEKNFFDIGRYSAVATLIYGTESRKTEYRTTYFYVIPWIPLGSILGFLAIFAFIIRLSLRRYISRAILLERERLIGDGVRDADIPREFTLSALKRPIAEGARDMRSLVRGVPPAITGGAAPVPGRQAGRRYHAAAALFLGIIVGLGLIGWYFYQVFESERGYRVEVKKEV